MWIPVLFIIFLLYMKVKVESCVLVYWCLCLDLILHYQSLLLYFNPWKYWATYLIRSVTFYILKRSVLWFIWVLISSKALLNNKESTIGRYSVVKSAQVSASNCVSCLSTRCVKCDYNKCDLARLWKAHFYLHYTIMGGDP